MKRETRFGEQENVCLGEAHRTLWRQEAMLDPSRKQGVSASCGEVGSVTMFMETRVPAWSWERVGMGRSGGKRRLLGEGGCEGVRARGAPRPAAPALCCREAGKGAKV